jgi:hypothetical protein
MVVEPSNCSACGGSGYMPGHEPTEQGVPYRFCPTCQGLKSRIRAMPLEDFAELFQTSGQPWPDNIRVRKPVKRPPATPPRSPNEGEVEP